MLEKLCNQIIDEDDLDMFEILSPYEIAQAIKNLLTRYKQLEEENVELRIENSAMNTVLEDLKARLL